MPLSRAFCAGLIEAVFGLGPILSGAVGYPVLFARASLKRRRRVGIADHRHGYPVLFARASLKPMYAGGNFPSNEVIPCFLRGPH